MSRLARIFIVELSVVVAGLSIIMALIYFLPRSVCVDRPYEDGHIEVCHVQPSFYATRGSQ